MNVSDVWSRNHPWASLYSFGIDRPRLSKPVARAWFGTDLSLLYQATEAIGELPAGSAVLDVPCGSGVAVRGIRPGQELRYTAADISTAMLERTRAAAEAAHVSDQVDTRIADVQEMPFADGEFDMCVSFTGFHCFPDPRAAIHEIGRVLKQGGELSASWFRTDAGPRFRPQITLGRMSGLLGPSAGVRQVREWLGEAGFEETAVTESGALAYVTAVRA